MKKYPKTFLKLAEGDSNNLIFYPFKKNLSISILALIVIFGVGGMASQAFAAPALVANVAAQASGGSVTATTGSINTTGATLLTACVAGFNVLPTAPTDSKSNTWVRAGSIQTSGSSNVALYYVVNPTVGSGHTFAESSDYPQIMVSAWSGVKTSSPLDQTNGAGSISTLTQQTGSITPAQAGELLMSCVSGTFPSFWTINSGFSLINTIIVNGIRLQDASLVQGSVSTINPTWTADATTNDQAAVIGSFKSAPDYTISGATSGFVGVASSNIIWTKASGTWDGSTTLTVSDGGQGGAWGGSCLGTSTGTFIPSNGTSTFNCTYTASAAGSFTMTPTNSAGEIDPSTFSWNSSNPAITFTGAPTTGTKNATSSSFTVALNTGAIFGGSVVITDGGNGGLITPSVGSACNTPCSVPATGLTSFTVTYTPVVIGILPLTTTNTFGYVNATPVNDVVTFSGSLHTAIANGNWNVGSTWDTGTVPVSGDTWKINGFTVHVPTGYTAISGGCSATSITADGEIDNGGALMVDSGATFRMQGNIKMNGTAGVSTNVPILQYSTGSIITPDSCGGSVVYGPFTVNSGGFNVINTGVDTATVTTGSGANPTVTWNSGQIFNTSIYPGSNWNIDGVSYPVASCADTTHCIITGTPGALTNVLSLMTQSGALTTWPPPTRISAINNTGANPVYVNLNGNFDSTSVTAYGVAISHCGDATHGCAPHYMLNNTSLRSLIERQDWQNFTWDFTGGNPAAGQTSTFGTIFIAKDGRTTNSLGASDFDPEHISGAYSAGTVCDVENVYMSAAFGSFTVHFNGCTVKDNIFVGDIFSAGDVSATNKWALFDSNIINRKGGEFSLGGSDSNNLLAYQPTQSSAHFSAYPQTVSTDVVSNGDIFEWDNTTSEGHCLIPSAISTSLVTVTNMLVLPSPVDGRLSCTGWIVGANGANSKSVLTMTHSTFFGQPAFASGVSVGHNGQIQPTGVTVPTYKENLHYQSGVATGNSMPIACSLSAAAPCSTIPADTVTASGIDYNGLFHQQNSTLFGVGFNANASPSTSNNTPYAIATTVGTPGVHDVVTDPHFIDPTRTSWTWAVTQGQAASSAGFQAVFANAAPSTYPTLLASFLTYVHAGYVPTNPLLKASIAHTPDGLDIGAQAVIDITPPIVQLTVPANLATVSGSAVTLTASSTDDFDIAGEGVQGVKFYYDSLSHQIGSEITATSSPNTYQTTWNTVGLDGPHNLFAVSRDLAGNTTTSASIAVTVSNAIVPGAPTIGTATAGNAQASVTFTAPVSDGGTTIDGYIVTSIPSGGTDTNAGTTGLSHLVNGLTNGTSYTFTVTAHNSVGTSTPSSTSNPVTPTASAAPVITLISSGTPGQASATITWATDIAANSQVEYGTTGSYTASSTLDSTLVTSHSIDLTGLSASTGYHFRILSSSGILAVSTDQTFTTAAVPNNGGGGGGGGIVFSSTVTNFQATPGNTQVLLSWTNPSNPSFTSLTIVRKSGTSSASSLLDGLQVFAGTGQSFLDTDLTNGQIYSYALFPLTSSGTALTPVPTAQATPQANLTLLNPPASTPASAQPSPGLVIPQTSGIAIRLINDNGTYFLILSGEKHGITDPGILNSFGFTLKDAVPATSGDAAISQGSLLLPGDGALVKSVQDPTVYLVSGGQRYGFTSASVFNSLGFKFSSVVVVTNPELQALPKVTNLSDAKAAHLPGVNINHAGTIYWIGNDNLRHPYQSLTDYNSWNIHNDFSRVVAANSADLSLPIGDAVVSRIRQ